MRCGRTNDQDEDYDQKSFKAALSRPWRAPGWCPIPLTSGYPLQGATQPQAVTHLVEVQFLKIS
jgi:hypothetical protein